MRPSTSYLLDGLRVISAGLVFVYHCFNFWKPAWFHELTMVGHGAVVVFFVLSGYVIAHTTYSRRKTDLRAYVVARASRLYSVILPAVLLTLALYGLGSQMNPEAYSGRGHEVVRTLICLVNLQNIWFFSASPVTNGPFWSLSYEFWYYILFGLAVLCHGRGKWIWLGLAMGVAGPNIWLLAPCWLAGVVAYRLSRTRSEKPRWAPAGTTVALLAVLALFIHSPFPVLAGDAPLFYSGVFYADWVMAGLLALGLVCFDALAWEVNPQSHPVRLVRHLADHTFSLYLLHYPLLFFVSAVWVTRQHPTGLIWLAATGVLATIYLISLVTEAKRDLIRKLLNRIGNPTA